MNTFQFFTFISQAFKHNVECWVLATLSTYFERSEPSAGQPLAFQCQVGRMGCFQDWGNYESMCPRCGNTSLACSLSYALTPRLALVLDRMTLDTSYVHHRFFHRSSSCWSCVYWPSQAEMCYHTMETCSSSFLDLGNIPFLQLALYSSDSKTHTFTHY